MRRWSSAAAVACSVGCLGLAAIDPSAAAAAGHTSGTGHSSARHASPDHGERGPSVRVTPNRALVEGELVRVTGRGLTRPAEEDRETWFVIECTSAVRGHVNPSTDTAHCDVTAAHGVRVAHNGSFSTTYRVRTGIVGDGYCGTPGHLSCVLGVGTARGRGTVVRITFKSRTRPTTTSTTAASTSGPTSSTPTHSRPTG